MNREQAARPAQILKSGHYRTTGSPLIWFFRRSASLLHRIWHKIAECGYKQRNLFCLGLFFYGLWNISSLTVLASGDLSGLSIIGTFADSSAFSISNPYSACLSLWAISIPSKYLTIVFPPLDTVPIIMAASGNRGCTSYPICTNTTCKIYANELACIAAGSHAWRTHSAKSLKTFTLRLL
jgi:hypothetical protein